MDGAWYGVQAEHLSVADKYSALNLFAFLSLLQVVIAVIEKKTFKVIHLLSLFQFCRYFALIRRLSDCHEHIEDEIAGENSMTEQTSDNVSFAVHGNAAPLQDSEQDFLVSARAKDSELCSGKRTHELKECIICCDETEYFVLVCCSHGLCAECEKQWVRKQLRCPFCRRSFSSVREAVQSEWQLDVSAIPMEQIMNDIHSLEQKIAEFWEPLQQAKLDCSIQVVDCEKILAENYARRRQRTIDTKQDAEDGFVIVGR